MVAFIIVSVDAALVPAVFGKSFIVSVDCTAAIFVDDCWDVALILTNGHAAFVCA